MNEDIPPNGTGEHDEVPHHPSPTLADWRRQLGGKAQPIPGLRLGLDIDGTITLDPKLFADVATCCQQAGGQVHIVTSRSEVARAATMEELQGYSLPFDALHFLGEMSRAKEACPHKSLDWYQSYLWQKVAYAKQHGLMHFVDDDPMVLTLFAAYAPEVVTTSAMDRIKVPDPLYEQAIRVVLERQCASISLIQRHLKLGYNRTCRLMEAMAGAGIVSKDVREEGLRGIQDR